MPGSPKLSLPFKPSDRNFVGYEEFWLLGYDAVLSSRSQTFRRNVLPPSSASKSTPKSAYSACLFALLFDPEDGGSPFLGSIGRDLPNHSASIPEDSMPCSCWSPRMGQPSSVWSPSRPAPRARQVAAKQLTELLGHATPGHKATNSVTCVTALPQVATE
jgi:hypothetical protein